MPVNRYPKVYCESTEALCPLIFYGLQDNDLKEFTCSFEALIQKDSGKKSFGFSQSFLDISVKDVDKVVDTLGGEKDSSMDCLIPIANYNAENKTFSHHRWLMVELKLNSTVAKNDKDALLKKVNDTVALVSNEVMDPDRVFVYPDVCCARKSSLFVQWKNGSNKNMYKNWQCLSPKQFQEYLLLKENLPYHPVYSQSDLAHSFSKLVDIDSISNELNLWKNKAESYNARGNRLEYENILSLLARIFDKIMARLSDEEDKMLLTMEWSFLTKFL